MRVILDTNVVISGMIAPTGIPAKLLEAWIVRRFTLISHKLQIEEIRDVTRREKIRALLRPADAGRLVNLIANIAEFPDRLPDTQRSPDPRDDFLLALCETGDADILVSGDKTDLLALGSHGRTKIVTAAIFAEQLGLGRNTPGKI